MSVRRAPTFIPNDAVPNQHQVGKTAGRTAHAEWEREGRRTSPSSRGLMIKIAPSGELRLARSQVGREITRRCLRHGRHRRGLRHQEVVV
jgi:hypothetical protein